MAWCAGLHLAFAGGPEERMEQKHSKVFTVLPSQIDAYGRLSVPETFDLFMDIATEAATAIGVGVDFLKRRGLFWITVKTRIRFIKRPALMDEVRVSTWPERPVGKRCNRYYEICDPSGESLVQGKTEWAIVSALTGRPQDMEKLMPEGLDTSIPPVCPEPFGMIDEAFGEAPFAEHTVTATDIDMAGHMNNVAYVRAIVNAFSVKAWRKLDVREMTVVFRASAHEGDRLLLQKRQSGDILDLRGSLPNGKTIVLARLITGRR